MNILIIVAHPDDPEFFCGGSIARWCAEGHTVRYVLVTDGSKGNDDPSISAAQLIALRQDEQRAAAAELGVTNVHFLPHVDGELVNTLALQRDIAREVRRFRADIVVTTDPQTLHYGALRVNHNDHRVMGMAVCDAIFPAAGNRMFFPELLDDGFEPHGPHELWFTATTQPNHLVDISTFIDAKICAVRAHVSQVKNPAAISERLQQGIARFHADGSLWLAEGFRRIRL
ncbi:MAG: PIG-L family deacetylase [Chloroflexi bacterium]|nr:PIG-L family deacetylase [Chloroflexota bacterium]